MLCVSTAVTREFWKPILSARDRQALNPADLVLVSVPKATVHEDDLAAAREDKIGLAWELGHVESKPIAEAMDQFSNGEFGFHTFRLDVRHDLAATLPGDDIGHRHVYQLTVSPINQSRL